tara:strand:- start:12505 stop:13473 length:969 start_codon:yes stop_codon:yes gene_type:complete
MKYKFTNIVEDASFRKFYRLILNKNKRIIIFAEKEKYKNLIAYTAVNKFLRQNYILSPKLYSYNLEKGIIVIEDFGDQSFYKILLNQKKKLNTYVKLVDLLLKIQKIKVKSKINNIIGKSHVIEKYSVNNLHRESDLFFDWYLPLLFKKKKVLKIKKRVRKILSKIYKSLNFPNIHFVHRDFHVQNLMKVKKKIGVIDNQDAIIGNPAYDLVSLVDDVRIKTSKKLKKQIYEYYLKKTSKTYRIQSDKFLHDFNVLSIQRNMKIIGIFSRLFIRDKKKRYMKLIPYTWKLLGMRMEAKFFSELKEILDQNIPLRLRKKILIK